MGIANGTENGMADYLRLEYDETTGDGHPQYKVYQGDVFKGRVRGY